MSDPDKGNTASEQAAIKRMFDEAEVDAGLRPRPTPAENYAAKVADRRDVMAGLRELRAEAATLRAALAERDATIARVRALHLPDRAFDTRWCLHDGDDWGWPCPTIRALDGTP